MEDLFGRHPNDLEMEQETSFARDVARAYFGQMNENSVFGGFVDPKRGRAVDEEVDGRARKRKEKEGDISKGGKEIEIRVPPIPSVPIASPPSTSKKAVPPPPPPTPVSKPAQPKKVRILKKPTVYAAPEPITIKEDSEATTLVRTTVPYKSDTFEIIFRMSTSEGTSSGMLLALSPAVSPYVTIAKGPLRACPAPKMSATIGKLCLQKILIDTGTEMNIMSEEIWRKIGLAMD